MNKDIYVSRFSDAIWHTEPLDIIVGGAGGIGNVLCLYLSRLRHNLHVYDMDTVEAHNLGTQGYRVQDLGKVKVDALAEIIKEFSDHEIETYNEKYDLDSMSSAIMFSAFDNMQARKDMFANWCDYVTENSSEEDCVFIDARLLAEELKVFVVTPDRIEEYKNEWLFDDSDVPDASCTMKQTTHFAAICAGLMVSLFTNWLTNTKEESRQVPFLSTYFGPLCMMNNE